MLRVKKLDEENCSGRSHETVDLSVRFFQHDVPEATIEMNGTLYSYAVECRLLSTDSPSMFLERLWLG